MQIRWISALVGAVCFSSSLLDNMPSPAKAVSAAEGVYEGESSVAVIFA